MIRKRKTIILSIAIIVCVLIPLIYAINKYIRYTNSKYIHNYKDTQYELEGLEFLLRLKRIEEGCVSCTSDSVLNVNTFPVIVDINNYPHIYPDFGVCEIRLNNKDCPKCVLTRFPGKNNKYDSDTYDINSNNNYDDIILLNDHFYYKPGIIDKGMKHKLHKFINYLEGWVDPPGLFWELTNNRNKDKSLTPARLILDDFHRIDLHDEKYKDIQDDINFFWLGHDLWNRDLLTYMDNKCNSNLLIISRGANGKLDNNGYYERFTWNARRVDGFPSNDDIVNYNGLIYCGMEGVAVGYWPENVE